ncbi:hypothetical protein G6F65_018222 [Rhizopus arrhizus]|nr:hypothetical protein G6F65_018222 [Rhizopus arrhizus]
MPATGRGRTCTGAERWLGQPQEGNDRQEDPAQQEEDVVEAHLRCLVVDHVVQHRRAMLQVTLPHCRHLVLHARLIGRDVLGQVGMVHLGAPRPQPRRQRCREAAAQRTQEGGQAGARRDLAPIQVRQQDLQHRHEEQRDTNTHDQLHAGHVHVVHLQVEVRAQEAGHRQHDEGHRGQHAHVEARCVLAHERGHDHRQDADRRGRQARPDRGVAHVTLQPLREQQGHAEERRIGHHHRQRTGAEVAMAEQLQVDDRILVGQFPDQEHRQRHHGHTGQHHDLHRREPVLVIAQVEHQL